MQYNTYFQTYLNSVLPVIATILSVALGIAGGVMASTLVKRYKTMRAKRQAVIPSRTTTRTHRTRTQPASVKPKSKTTNATAQHPLRPTSTPSKRTRAFPSVSLPRFILEPEKPGTAEKKDPTKSENVPDKSHSRDRANQRTPQ